MRRAWTWLRLLFKRQLKKISLYIMLAFMVLACVGIRYTAKNFSVVIEFGVVNQDGGNVSSMIEKGLYGYKGMIAFKMYNTPDELKKDVQGGRLFGGYILKEGFSEKLMSGEISNTIETLSTPNSLASDMANEMFFSFVMKELSYEGLVKDTIDTKLFTRLSEEEIRWELREYFEESLSDGRTFALKYDNAPESDNTVELDIYDYISPVAVGLVGLVIFIGGLSGAISYYDDRKNNSFVLVSPVLRQVIAAIEIAIPVMIITAAGTATVLVTGLEDSLVQTAAKYGLYALIVIIYCYILKTIIPSKEVYVSLIPLLILASVVFCPVFANVASFSPALAGVGKIVPLYWLYML